MATIHQAMKKRTRADPNNLPTGDPPSPSANITEIERAGSPMAVGGGVALVGASTVHPPDGCEDRLQPVRAGKEKVTDQLHTSTCTEKDVAMM